jgi:phage tail-like protein
MANGTVNDPLANFNFLVEIDGITRAAFHKCSGFASTVDVIEYNEGGSLSPIKLPGMVKYANVVLERGMTSDMELYQWHLAAVQGQVQRKNGSIVVLDRASNEVARLDFTQAWPAKASYTDLSAQGNEVFFETFEIVCQTLTRVE